MRQIEKAVLLQTLDQLWREHLVTLEHLRQALACAAMPSAIRSTNTRARRSALFSTCSRAARGVTGQIMHVELAAPEEVPPLDAAELPPMEVHHFDPNTGEDEFALEGANGGGDGGGAKIARAQDGGFPCGHRDRGRRRPESVDPADPTSWGKVQRNALCPCGSGKKYKHCHGTFAG